MEAEQSNHDGGESLAEDIVFDVLARLPAKPLCRFRCVCKGWRALISDPAFVAVQRSRAGPHLVDVSFGVRSRPPNVRVMDMYGNVVRVLEVLVLAKDDGDVFGVLQATTSRHDLICALGQLWHGDRCRAGAMIINLAAGRACIIVDMDIPMAASCSIGRAALSGAYKVICLHEIPPYWICKCKVATIGGAETLTWRQRSPPPFSVSRDSREMATVNGIVYFMARFNEHDAASGPSRIAAFDLESEEWKMINGPTLGIQEKIGYLYLKELKGCLGVVQFQCDLPNLFEPYDDDYYAVIWLLIDPNKSVWVKDCTIQMAKTWLVIKQLWALDDGRILLLVSEFIKKVISKRKECIHQNVLVYYHPSTKTFTKYRGTPVGFYHDELVLYTGSLLSP